MADRAFSELQHICCRHASMESMVFKNFIARPISSTVDEIVACIEKLRLFATRYNAGDTAMHSILANVLSVVNDKFGEWIMRARHTVFCLLVQDVVAIIRGLAATFNKSVENVFEISKTRPVVSIDIETMMTWKSTPLHRKITAVQFREMCRLAFPILFPRGPLATFLREGDFEMFELHDVTYSSHDEWTFRNFTCLLCKWLCVRSSTSFGDVMFFPWRKERCALFA